MLDASHAFDQFSMLPLIEIKHSFVNILSSSHCCVFFADNIFYDCMIVIYYKLMVVLRMNVGRFDEVLLVPPADETGREQILQRISRSIPFHPDVDLNHLSKISARFTAAVIALILLYSYLYHNQHFPT